MVSILMSNEIRYLHFLLFFCSLLSSASELVSQDSSKMMVNIRCIETERRALLDIRRSLVDIYGRLSSWGNSHDDENCCQWSGVACDLHTGHVTHLNISYLNYFNNNRSRSKSLSNISYLLMHLRHLQYLDLSRNEFAIPIPNFIGSLTKLVHLDLSEADFRGVVPDELGNLSKLNYLDLSSNTFELSPLPKFIASFSSLNYLDLSDNQFSGALPHQFGNLSKLHYLDLSSNKLQGQIPNSFGVMIGINHLNLSSNHLKGVIPNSLHYLSSLRIVDFNHNDLTGNLQDLLYLLPPATLQKLWISKNQLTGSLPDITRFSFLKELKVDSNQLNGYLPKVFEHKSVLQSLDLSNNYLQGSLPNFTRLSFLKNLALNDNKFSGSLPDFTGCSSLQVLRLNNNQLAKWETQSTGLLTSLRKLDLSMNSIRSTISEANLYNLSSLKYMRTSFNPLTFDISYKWLPPFQLLELSLASCKLGPKFPNWIRNQEYINHLDISNSQISDDIPIWFANLSTVMHHINLSSNKIRGNFLFDFVLLKEIDLSSNCFDGPLPRLPAECLRINLSQNKFSGTLHSLSVVEDLPLRFLDISHNQLSGALLKNWIHFQGLVFLNLGYNNFSGRIPTSIGHLNSLETMILRNNKLYGELPTSLRNCSSLGFADFGLNKLSGEIPSWIGYDLKKLYALILKSNRFSGSMPHGICQLSNLHFLDLSINRISGTIPPCLCNLTAMIQNGTEVSQHTYSSYYEKKVKTNYISYGALVRGTRSIAPPIYSYFDNVLARWKGQELEYGRNFAYLKMIDLSRNELTGEIPMGITRLLDLKGLNLSGNRFYGYISPDIGQLKVLECLDLSTNKFSGEIPLSLSGLSFLAYLDLSNNNFSGRIPSGTQLVDLMSLHTRGTLDCVVNHSPNYASEMNRLIPSSHCPASMNLMEKTMNMIRGCI